jgi:UDP-N-acetylmuramate--alanine ligase
LWDEFVRAFNEADVLALVDVYAAGEAPVPGITSEALANGIREAGHKNVQYFRSMQDAIEFLLREAKPGDALMTIGAGNVSRASNELMVLLGTELRVEDRIRNAD